MNALGYDISSVKDHVEEQKSREPDNHTHKQNDEEVNRPV